MATRVAVIGVVTRPIFRSTHDDVIGGEPEGLA
jgi:hypothetical protein